MDKNRFLGRKDNIDLYNNLFNVLVPNKIKLYVEPFGGSFGLFKLISERVKYSIYNDIHTPTFEEYGHIADEYYNEDFEIIITKFDSEDTIFYIDPPYYGKENYYEHKFEEHQKLHDVLTSIKGKFILSYNDVPDITKMYNDFIIYRYQGKSIYHKPEIAITNIYYEDVK